MTTKTLLRQVDDVLADAFASLSLPAELAHSTFTARTDLGDLQCNGAMPAGKRLRQNSRALAERLVNVLSSRPEFSAVTVAGPGFINLSLADEFLIQACVVQSADPNVGVAQPFLPERIVLDFGGPNMAKPLHVGHLRSLVIGESLRRILSASGHHVTSDVHLGDWGLQMGQLISYIEDRYPSLPYFDPDYVGSYPDASPVSLAELEVIYPAAVRACKDSPARLKAARLATVQLQIGRPGYRALWTQLRNLSLSAQQKNFHELGAHFDLLEGESTVEPLITPLIDDLKAKGIAVESEGALVIEVAEEAESLPPLLLAKADGGALYATTDLATLADRVARFKPSRIVYVVDQRQALHFEQVFRAARKSGIVSDCALDHVGFGTMNGKDGKPLKTRDGGVPKLSDLLAEAVGKAAERLAGSEHAKELSPMEQQDLARKVAIAAIKFADLSSHRISGYVFDVDRLVSFEGGTGPYLQYACVRMSSILAKANEHHYEIGPFEPKRSSERALVLYALRFPHVVALAAESLLPSLLADYSLDVAQHFSRFYADCRILDEPDDRVRASRLAICQLTYQVLSRLLWMLGIDVPARM